MFNRPLLSKIHINLTPEGVAEVTLPAKSPYITNLPESSKCVDKSNTLPRFPTSLHSRYDASLCGLPIESNSSTFVHSWLYGGNILLSRLNKIRLSKTTPLLLIE